MADAGRYRLLVEGPGGGGVGGQRFLAVHRLARLDGPGHRFRPDTGHLGIEIDLHPGVGQDGVQVGGPPFHSVALGETGQAIGAASHQDGHR